MGQGFFNIGLTAHDFKASGHINVHPSKFQVLLSAMNHSKYLISLKGDCDIGSIDIFQAVKEAKRFCETFLAHTCLFCAYIFTFCEQVFTYMYRKTSVLVILL